MTEGPDKGDGATRRGESPACDPACDPAGGGASAVGAAGAAIEGAIADAETPNGAGADAGNGVEGDGIGGDGIEDGGAAFSDLVRSLPIGVYRTRPDGELVIANAALVALYGYGSLAEMQAASRRGDVRWYADPGRRAAFKRLMESWGEIDRLVSEVESRDGRRIWVSETARAVPGPDGAPAYFEGAMQDITDLQSVQRALRESERRFRDYAEVASDWFWETDENLRFSYFSDTLTTETGLDPRALLGHTRDELADAEAHADPRWRAHIADMEAHRAFDDFRYEMTRPDGEVIVISASGIPVYDESGAFKGYRGVGSNVTEEARTQASLHEAKLQAEFANRAKSEFIANISHELRTPLNAIIGFSEIMQDELFGAIGVGRYKRYVADINASASHLLSIINMILDLSKIEAGKLELDDRPIDLADCIGGALQLVGPLAREREIVLERSIAEDLRTLQADERALRQMLLNLLSNAIKFSESGARVDTVIERSAETGEATIAVIDRGDGIPADKIDLVTQPFGHSESPTTRSSEGSGLGLAITQRLIELHGGRLEIDSRLGEGTTVRLVFPTWRVGA